MPSSTDVYVSEDGRSRLEVSGPRPSNTEVFWLGSWFGVEYKIRNMGEEPIGDIKATLGFSNDNLEAVISAAGEKAPRTREIGTLMPWQERYVFWLIDTRRAGYTDIIFRVVSSAGEVERNSTVRVV